MQALLGQVVHGGGGAAWSIGDIATVIIVIVAIVAIVIIFLRVSGVQVASWVWQILGIVLAAFLCIIAIRFLLTM